MTPSEGPGGNWSGTEKGAFGDRRKFWSSIPSEQCSHSFFAWGSEMAFLCMLVEAASRVPVKLP